LAAVNNDENALKYASKRLKDNKEIILNYITNDESESDSDWLKDNEEHNQ